MINIPALIASTNSSINATNSGTVKDESVNLV